MDGKDSHQTWRQHFNPDAGSDSDSDHFYSLAELAPDFLAFITSATEEAFSPSPAGELPSGEDAQAAVQDAAPFLERRPHDDKETQE